VAGVAVIALLAVLVAPRFGAESPPRTAFGPPASAMAPTGPAAIDLSSMTAREAADRLFDRIMRTAGAGDSAEARAFVPMALEAYRQVPEPDADAHYHLAVLHMLVDNAAEARIHADAILRADPDHLFGLFMAGQSAQRLGDAEEARSLFRRFLDRYPTEIARDLPEYAAHSPVFPEMHAEAQAAVR
jgi:tetratricopeptide (TPR) repeat protein